MSRAIRAAVVMVVAVVALVAVAAPARADGQVALLPLDADQQLELYGQPIASEIARALAAGGVDVVVVGPKSSVPEHVSLIVDGKISVAKGDAVALSIRVRDPAGNTLDTLAASAGALTELDRAAADLAARVLPTVKGRLAAAAHPTSHPAGHDIARAPKPAAAAVATPMLPMIVAVSVADKVTAANTAPLAAALTRAVEPWARDHHREPRSTGALADLVSAVAGGAASMGVTFEVLGYDVVSTPTMMARARIHVRIADPSKLLFDRVIATDTVVGERAMAPEALAERVAAAVLAILAPHVPRAVPSWSR